MVEHIQNNMKPEHAFEQLLDEFPFENYIECKHLSNVYKTVTDTVLTNLPSGSKILDFGCGPCDKTIILKKLGYDCYGYDDLQDDWHKINDNRKLILNNIKQNGIKFIDAGIEKEWPFNKSEFDMVILNDVIEHLHDSPRVLLNDLVDILKDGGLLFITVPNAGNIRKRIHLMLGKTNLPPFNGYYWSPGPWRDHIREYVLNDLKKLAFYLELKIIEIKARDHMLVPGKMPKAFIPLWKAITVLFPGWKDSWSLLAMKPNGWTGNRDPREIEGYTFNPIIKDIHRNSI